MGNKKVPALKLEKELQALFGREVFTEAKSLNCVNRFSGDQVDDVASVADRILDRAGRPWDQIKVVSELDRETSLLLCAWLLKGGVRLFNCSLH